MGNRGSASESASQQQEGRPLNSLQSSSLFHSPTTNNNNDKHTLFRSERHSARSSKGKNKKHKPPASDLEIPAGTPQVMHPLHFRSGDRRFHLRAVATTVDEPGNSINRIGSPLQRHSSLIGRLGGLSPQHNHQRPVPNTQTRKCQLVDK